MHHNGTTLSDVFRRSRYTEGVRKGKSCKSWNLTGTPPRSLPRNVQRCKSLSCMLSINKIKTWIMQLKQVWGKQKKKPQSRTPAQLLPTDSLQAPRRGLIFPALTAAPWKAAAAEMEQESYRRKSPPTNVLKSWNILTIAASWFGNCY